MLFNSMAFFVFFVCVYGVYLSVSHRWQNRILLLASYVFYAAWDWRFLFLLWISTIVDYFCGLKITSASNQKSSKKYLFLSLFVNLSILCVFKYFNFFTENFYILFKHLGLSIHPRTFNIILPMGISFYTFQTMSYTIDVYKRKMKPTRNFLNFALFVSFFPQLVAGPIERAKSLLPQISNPRILSWQKFNEGCFLIFWGLFQKIFVADNLAKITDSIFAQTGPFEIDKILLGAYAFAFQIFCDFAGYSSIARGLSRCMGFELMVNFNLPYFATNPQDFWRRWHISLSTWLRDYLYIPLGGDRRGSFKTYQNLMIVMVLGGLWHGAAWNFLIWGMFHGLILAIHRLFKKSEARKPDFVFNITSKFVFGLKVIFFFHVTCLGWLIFRAQSIHQIHEFIIALVSGWASMNIGKYLQVLEVIGPYVYILLIVQLIQFIKKDLMAIYHLNTLVKSIFYFLCILVMIIWGVTDAQDFIYFQF